LPPKLPTWPILGKVTDAAAVRLTISEKHMSALKDHYSEAIEAAISKAKTCRDLATVEAFDGTEAYAYPHRASLGASILRKRG
jgi:hypothetical protein